MAVSKDEQAISSSGQVVISRLSAVRISCWIFVMTAFYSALATMPAWGTDLSRTVFRLDRNESLRVCSEIFFALSACVFLALLLRRVFFGNLAIYADKNRLFWVNALWISSLSLKEIATIEKWAAPGMISIRTDNGGQRYIATSVTNLTANQTVSAILALLEASNLSGQ